MFVPASDFCENNRIPRNPRCKRGLLEDVHVRAECLLPSTISYKQT